MLIFWAIPKIRAKKVEDRSALLSTSVQCKICGQDNPPEAGFCGNCGAALVAAVEPPSSAVVTVEYVGSNTRVGAAIIDGIIVWMFSWVLLRLILLPMFWFLPDMFWFLLLLSLYHWLFTGLRGQTPGKMAVRIKVVDVQGDRPGLGVAAMREILGKLISTIGLCLGFARIDRDKQKRGWHDRIAGTYVVKVVKAKSKE